MTRALAVLGLAVLVGVVLPLGVWLTLVVIASDRPFHEDRTLAAAAGGVGVLGNGVSVSVMPSPDGAVHVTTDGRSSLFDPQLLVGPMASGTLALPSTVGPEAVGVLVNGCWRCTIGVTVAVPPGLPVGVSGTVDTITATGLTGPVRLQTSNGAITGRDLAGPSITADTANGPIAVALRAPATVRATSGNGDLTVIAPPTGRYALDPQTGSGTVTATLLDDPLSPDVISAHTGRGAVVLAPR